MSKASILDDMPNELMDFMVLSKLLERVRFNGTCWEVRPDGNQHRGPSKKISYSRIWHPKTREKILAHRYMMAVIRGEAFENLPKGFVVMHSCDNPLCIFPGHLSLGTQQENVQDSWKRTRR